MVVKIAVAPVCDQKRTRSRILVGNRLFSARRRGGSACRGICSHCCPGHQLANGAQEYRTYPWRDHRRELGSTCSAPSRSQHLDDYAHDLLRPDHRHVSSEPRSVSCHADSHQCSTRTRTGSYRRQLPPLTHAGGSRWRPHRDRHEPALLSAHPHLHSTACSTTPTTSAGPPPTHT